MLPVIERLGGQKRVSQMLARAGIFQIPDGTGMIPEQDAARLHRQLRLEEPELAPCLATEAGRLTADYILANRIPKPAQALLRILPARPSAKLLSTAIARHAWTFAGSGSFKVRTPWSFEITNNPIVRNEHAAQCLCHWHAAVFAQLYRVLVHPNCTCNEVDCLAMGAGHSCSFELMIA